MIKQISASQLAIGMFVHDLNCGWMAHPFLTNQFAVKDTATIRKILDAGIREVSIDTSRGADLAGEQKAVAVLAESAKQIEPAAPILIPPAPLAEELQRARKLHHDANKLVSGLMHDIRLGKQIEVEQCEPLVAGIIDSIFRMPSALLPLAQVKTRDEYTFQHSVSVAALSVAFGRALELPRDVIQELALGGLLHDVGKALVPPAVLGKPGKLTDAEFVVMKHHAAQGAELLENLPGISEIAFQAAAQHHERFDGSGYPHGLKGDAISIYGQMMAIVDVYDAITSLRVYHKGIPPTEALKSMFEWSGTQFNPRLVQAFIKSIGIYPAGSLVRMASGKIGIVREVVPSKLLQPVVKVFYHADKRCYLDPETIDLSAAQDKIVAHESFEKWGIDQARWL
ncbi:MAG TPA: HD-GYP domain-containing protein [Rhodocyclaceae bacterium]